MTTIIVNPGEDIQTVINKASTGDVVQLRSGLHQLSDRLTLKSNLTILGENGTIIKAGPTTGGVVHAGIGDGWFYCSNLMNVEISNLIFKSTATGILDGGLGESRNCIILFNCSHFKIHDCTVAPYVYNDFVKCHGSSDIKVFNNKGQSAHDFIEYLSNSHDCEAYGNDVVIQTNCGMRIDSSKNIHLYNNIFTGVGGSGWCVFEIEDTVTDCEIDHNICHDFKGSSGNNVVQPVHATVTNLKVHDNIIWSCGTIATGTSINNIIDPVDHTIANWTTKGYGPQTVNVVVPPATISVTPPVVKPIETPKPVVVPPIVPSKPVITEVLVGFDVKGTYNCTGTHDKPTDASVIQLAINFAHANKIPVVKLSGPHSYYINVPLDVPVDVKLVGDKGSQIVHNF